MDVFLGHGRVFGQVVKIVLAERASRPLLSLPFFLESPSHIDASLVHTVWKPFLSDRIGAAGSSVKGKCHIAEIEINKEVIFILCSLFESFPHGNRLCGKD